MPKPLPDLEGKPTVARKRAVAKIPAKKAAAKKTAVKKVAAKKTVANKATKKTPANDGQVELSLNISPPVSKTISETPAAPVKTPRARKTAAKPVAESAPAAAPTPAPVAADEPRRFGRVPGGGPVSQREAGNESPAPTPAPPPSEPVPQPPRPPQQREAQPPQPRDHQQPQQQRDGQNPESRSKRRREKRKRRRDQGPDNRDQGNRQRHEPNHPPRQDQNFQEDRRPVHLQGPKIEADGMLELAPKGFGFLRIPGKNFEQARDDVFVTPELIRKNNLRLGQWIHGLYQEGPRGPQLVEITQINGMTPEEASKLPHFDELKAINPNKRISFETTPERFTTRVVDLMAPVGKGQRGLIVSPPRSGKTTLLLHMAEAIREKYEETMHLMIVLVDERPEEVTEFRRALPGAEIYASSNDEQARNHCRIAELAIERAKRLVEAGKDVFLLMDSITRLARAYNGNMNNRGRGTASGGLTIGSLEVPRRLFAAARNTRGGGSLTILATALIQTNSRADEAIYMEFKGTGNMELVLDRKIAENYIYPAVDIFKSGTRREELLLPEHMLHKIHLIRRGLSGHRPAEAMERLLYFLKKFPNNPQMLLEIKG